MLVCWPKVVPRCGRSTRCVAASMQARLDASPQDRLAPVQRSAALSEEVRLLGARALLGAGALDEADAVVKRLRSFGYRHPDFLEACRRAGLSV
jgi:hypothetical protein